MPEKLKPSLKQRFLAKWLESIATTMDCFTTFYLNPANTRAMRHIAKSVETYFKLCGNILQFAWRHIEI